MAWICITLSTFLVPPPVNVGTNHSNTPPVLDVKIKLRTGGSISGRVVDFNDDALVIEGDAQFAFAWQDLDGGSACMVRKEILVATKRASGGLLAEDHFQLGLFALRQGRRDLAADAFREAAAKGRGFQTRIKMAFDEDRQKRDAESDALDSTSPLYDDDSDKAPTGSDGNRVPGDAASMDRELDSAGLTGQPSADFPAKVLEIYRRFGDKVREIIGQDVVLIETQHFLIWTDWGKNERQRLGPWCESMYAELTRQFELDPDADVFLAKCPMFCWRSKGRFRKFAEYFDGFDASSSVGYTRSIERNGHVHVVLLRQGDSPIDRDRFASTLVHEGTHAFLHRFHAPRLIPHWVNEGYAELMSECILRERSFSGETAALLARAYVRSDRPIGELLKSTDPPAVHEYPLAHSLILYLQSSGPSKLSGFIRGLKAGRDLPDALRTNYDGMTLDSFENSWRSWIRDADTAENRRAGSGYPGSTGRDD